MKYAILVSTKDIAGMNIKERLRDKGFVDSDEEKFGHAVLVREGVRLYTTDKDTIYCERIDSEIEGDRIIFATRHSSCSCKKTLSVHVPGNWGKAEAGGKDKILCTAMPSEMRKAYLSMMEKVETRKLDDFEVSLESTHHGPVLSKPCMFIEIGSEESSWKDEKAGGLIADVIVELLDASGDESGKSCESVVVLGGGHYNQTTNKLLLKTDYSVGHICPKHQLEDLDEEILKQALSKNGGKDAFVVLDWKGLSMEKERIVEMLDALGIRN